MSSDKSDFIKSPPPKMVGSLLDTLAEIASKSNPLYPVKQELVSENRRPRASSEPWLPEYSFSKSTLAPLNQIMVKKESASSSPSPTPTLPQMLEKYASIYNTNGRIGIYTREERDAIIARFRQKRKKRVWKKKIRYHCRKNLADSRVRVKGRFVKNNSLIKGDDITSDSSREGLGALLAATQMDIDDQDDDDDDYSSDMDEEEESMSSASNNGSNSSSQERDRPPRPLATNGHGVSSFIKNRNVSEQESEAIETLTSIAFESFESSLSQEVEGIATRRGKRVRRHSIAY